MSNQKKLLVAFIAFVVGFFIWLLMFGITGFNAGPKERDIHVPVVDTELPEPVLIKKTEELHIRPKDPVSQPSATMSPTVEVTNKPAPDTQKPVKGMVKPEDRGEKFNKYSDEIIAKKLVDGDKIEQRKVAIVIGDRFILSNSLPENLQNAVQKAVYHYLIMSKSSSSNDRQEARDQIARCWTAAAPALLYSLDSAEDMSQLEFIAKSLILMRNEQIIKELVKKYNAQTDKKRRSIFKMILMKMKEKRGTLVPNRKSISDDESVRIYDAFIAPAISKQQ